MVGHKMPRDGDYGHYPTDDTMVPDNADWSDAVLYDAAWHGVPLYPYRWDCESDMPRVLCFMNPDIHAGNRMLATFPAELAATGIGRIIAAEGWTTERPGAGYEKWCTLDELELTEYAWKKEFETRL